MEKNCRIQPEPQMKMDTGSTVLQMNSLTICCSCLQDKTPIFRHHDSPDSIWYSNDSTDEIGTICAPVMPSSFLRHSKGLA